MRDIEQSVVPQPIAKVYIKKEKAKWLIRTEADQTLLVYLWNSSAVIPNSKEMEIGDEDLYVTFGRNGQKLCAYLSL